MVSVMRSRQHKEVIEWPSRRSRTSYVPREMADERSGAGSRFDGATLVAWSGDLSDLPTKLRRLQRRRHWRPAGHYGPPRAHRIAWGRRDLALAFLQVTHEGFWVRRCRLL